MALLIERNIHFVERFETPAQFFKVGRGPTFFDGALKHERVGCALAETEQLDEEDSVVFRCGAGCEEVIKVCAETVFGLLELVNKV